MSTLPAGLDPWQLLEALPGLVLILDAAGCVRYRNAPGDRLGLAPDSVQLEGEYVAAFAHAFAASPADTDAVRQGMHAVLAGERPRFEYDYWANVGSDGRWFLLTLVPWQLDGGRGALAQHQDISSCQRSEQSLRQATAMLDAMPDMMFRLSRDGVYLDCKISSSNELYVPPERIVGRRLAELMPTQIADDWAHAITYVLSTGRPTVYEYGMPTPKGERIFEARLVTSGSDEVLTIVRDVTERKQAEAAMRESLNQAQIIRMQQLALRELSTPVIPLSQDVVVMPLIGAIDTQRAHQALEILLSAVAEQRARVAILDITGVPLVDTQVANVLLQATQAVRLLGAQIMLTGIRPEVAQTLVGLGIDMSSLMMRPTLREAIASALQRAR